MYSGESALAYANGSGGITYEPHASWTPAACTWQLVEDPVLPETIYGTQTLLVTAALVPATGTTLNPHASIPVTMTGAGDPVTGAFTKDVRSQRIAGAGGNVLASAPILGDDFWTAEFPVPDAAITANAVITVTLTSAVASFPEPTIGSTEYETASTLFFQTGTLADPAGTFVFVNNTSGGGGYYRPSNQSLFVPDDVGSFATHIDYYVAFAADGGDDQANYCITTLHQLESVTLEPAASGNSVVLTATPTFMESHRGLAIFS
jgi:hypothetical protein